MYPEKSMKELNHNIRHNEDQIRITSHRIRKLNGDYRKNYMNDLKQENKSVWNQLDSRVSNGQTNIHKCYGESETCENCTKHAQEMQEVEDAVAEAG